MSSMEQPLDSQLIEQTKQQIRVLVNEIAQLSKKECAPEEFYGEFLPRVVTALAAVGGAVWTVNSEGRLALQYQVNIQESGLRECNEEAQAQHSRLLYKVLSTEDGLMVPPHSGPGDDQGGQAANPTSFLLLFGLLKTDLETAGIVEIFQRGETGPNTQKGYLRFLLQMCELAGDFLKSHQLRHFSHRQVLWAQLEDFARVVHSSLDPRAAAYTIANEGRRLIECDRLSVAICKGKRCIVEAISGQDLFDKRSNTVRLLNKLATAVVASGDPMWYTGDTRDMPPQVEDALQAYVDEAHSKTVAVLPLRRPTLDETDDPNEKEKPEAPIGALIVEQIEDSRVPQSLMQRVDVVCRHSSTAMANAKEHQDLFLMPVWRALGKTRWVLQARTLPLTISIAIAVLGVVLFLCLYPAKFRLEAKGTLEPVLRQDVYAASDGTVEEIACDHGSKVVKDQLLVKLRNTEMEVALENAEGELQTNVARMTSLRTALVGERSIKPDQLVQMRADLAEAEEKARSARRQVELQRQKKQDLLVKSPMTGTVVTWELQNRLRDRVVQRGQSLLRVADLGGPWQLELHMPENRMGFVMAAQNEAYVKSREKLRTLMLEDARAEAQIAPAENAASPVTQGQERAEGVALPSQPDAAATKPDQGAIPLQPAPSQDLFKVDTPPGSQTMTEPGQATAEAGQPAGEVGQTETEAAKPAAAPSQTVDPAKQQEEAIRQKVEAELAGIPNEALRNAIEAVFQARFRKSLRTILAAIPAESPADTPASAMPAEQPTEKAPEILPQATPAEATSQEATFQEATPAEGIAESPAKATETITEKAADATPPKISNDELRTKLQAIVDEPSYDQAWLKLKALMAESIDGGVRAKLEAIPKEEWGEQLDVPYILATEPGKYHYGRVKEIHRSAEVRGDEGNTVLIKVAINKEELPKLQPGASVTAKVDCGRQPLGYVLLHDVIAFIQSRVLFKFF
jgi:hypothetical protein